MMASWGRRGFGDSLGLKPQVLLSRVGPRAAAFISCLARSLCRGCQLLCLASLHRPGVACGGEGTHGEDEGPPRQVREISQPASSLIGMCPCAVTEMPAKQVQTDKGKAKCQPLGGTGFHTSCLAWRRLQLLFKWSPVKLSKCLTPATCQAQHFPKCPGLILLAASFWGKDYHYPHYPPKQWRFQEVDDIPQRPYHTITTSGLCCRF